MSFGFFFYPYENLDLYAEKNREEVTFCQLNQHCVVNCLQPVKHSSAEICYIDYGGGFCLEYLNIMQVIKMLSLLGELLGPYIVFKVHF